MDRLVEDPDRLIIQEVDPQSTTDLLRAPAGPITGRLDVRAAAPSKVRVDREWACLQHRSPRRRYGTARTPAASHS